MTYPKGWREVGLLDIAPIKARLVDPKLTKLNEMVLIAPDHIQSGSGHIIEKVTAGKQGAISGKYFVRKNSVIYSKIRPYLMKAAIADDDVLCSADMYPFECTTDITPEFLLNVLLSKRFTDFAISCSNRTGIPKINREELAEFRFLLPPLREQAEINQFFRMWTTAVEKAEQLIEAKEKRHNGLIQALLSSRQARHWETIGFNDIVKERIEKAVSHDQYPVLTSSRRGLFLQSEYFSKQVTSKDNTGYKVLRRGDFTFRSMSDDGRFTFNRLTTLDAGIISPAYGVFYATSCSPEFLHHFLNSSYFTNALNRESQGGTRKALRSSSISRMEVDFPSLQEQEHIAAILDASLSEIAIEKQRLVLLKDQKRGLMQKLLTGQWRVKVDKPEVA